MAAGLLWAVYAWGRCLFEGTKDAIDDNEHRKRNIQKGENTYIDSKGKLRDVNTNRRLYMSVDKDGTHYVEKDLKTEQIVNVLGTTNKGWKEEKRRELDEQHAQYTKENKERAINNKKYIYCGYKRDSNYVFHNQLYRVSDDVLIEHSYYDNRKDYIDKKKIKHSYINEYMSILTEVKSIFNTYFIVFLGMDKKSNTKLLSKQEMEEMLKPIIQFNNEVIEEIKIKYPENNISFLINKYKPILSVEDWIKLNEMYS